MGSFISIGLIAHNKIIKKSVMRFLDTLPDFNFESVFFPLDNDYDEWSALNCNECSIEKAFDFVNNNQMSYFVGNFKLNNRTMENVEFVVEKSADNLTCCFIIKIPDKELLYSIDDSERCIIELLRKASGFNFAFCDSEAHLNDDNYSIFVSYSDNPQFVFNKWKIDGLSERG